MKGCRKLVIRSDWGFYLTKDLPPVLYVHNNDDNYVEALWGAVIHKAIKNYSHRLLLFFWIIFWWNKIEDVMLFKRIH